MRSLRGFVAFALVLGALGASRDARAVEPQVAECLSASESAQRLHLEGRERAARRAFVTCAAEACPAVVRKECIAALAELDRTQPTLVFDVRDPRGGDVTDVAVTMDGEPLASRLDGRPVAVDVGEHVFRFTPQAPLQPAELRVLARTGDRNRSVAVPLAEAPPAAAPASSPEAPSLVLPLAFGGVAVAAVSVFAIVGLGAKSDLNALERDPCAATRTCSPDDVSSVRTRFAVADVALGVGVVAAAVATYLLVTRGDAAKTAASPVLVRF